MHRYWEDADRAEYDLEKYDSFISAAETKKIIDRRNRHIRRATQLTEILRKHK